MSLIYFFKINKLCVWKNHGKSEEKNQCKIGK